MPYIKADDRRKFDYLLTMNIYVIGSLREPRVHDVATYLRSLGHEVFDDWRSPGPDTDEQWQAYEKARGRTYVEALAGTHADNVFEYDKKHLDAADAVVLVLPAGKSAHLELGYIIGKGKPGYILMDGEPDRFDIMYRFATKVVMDMEELEHEFVKLSPTYRLLSSPNDYLARMGEQMADEAAYRASLTEWAK